MAYLYLVRPMRALSIHTGGAWCGDGRWTSSVSTWPFAHLYVCDDRLILTTGAGAFEFPRERLIRLTRKDNWLARLLKLDFGAMRIEHAVADYPSYVLFQSFSMLSVCDALGVAGFIVNDLTSRSSEPPTGVKNS